MILNVIDWIFTEVVIHRNIFPLWYVATGIVLASSIVLSVLLKLKRFGFWILISAAILSTVWEVILFLFGLRNYDNELANVVGWLPELIYHSFSETAATFLLGLLLIYKLGIVDLEKFKDENWKAHKIEQKQKIAEEKEK